LILFLEESPRYVPISIIVGENLLFLTGEFYNEFILWLLLFND